MSNLLSGFFIGIGGKRLSSVEIIPKASNQHELNGINDLKKIFGSERKSFQGLFIYFSDDSDQYIEEYAILTWYDARINNPDRTEYRLYYSKNPVISKANPGDLAIIGLTTDKRIFVVISSRDSSSEQQLLWLFGLKEVESKFRLKIIADEDIRLDYAGKRILQTLGIELPDTRPDYLEAILRRFGNTFPSTAKFSEFARSTCAFVQPVKDPDNALIVWLEQEEMLFRTFEKHIVSEKLKSGFGSDGLDVQEFIMFSLSVQNRRKARAGYSFENHVAYILDTYKLSYSRGARTERNNKPDFLFPHISCYHDDSFPIQLCTLLGLKTTAKERWRQLLAEAEKISLKHLLTLEPAISTNQTDEMVAQSVQLIVPESIRKTYKLEQQKHIMNFRNFIDYVSEKQTQINGRRT